MQHNSQFTTQISPHPPLIKGEGIRQGDLELFHFDKWYPGQVELFQKKEDLSTADWAETHERWVAVSDKPGPWKNENNPALKGLMNLMDYARKLFVCVKGVQTGGTEAAQNYMCKKSDTAAGAIGLLVMDSERKLKRMMNTRTIVSFEKTPKLKERMSPNPDDTTNYSIKLQNGFTLNGAWASSHAMTTSDPCIFVIIDEIDKSKVPINIQDAKDRITVYEREGKVIILSTPSFIDGPIMKELRDCEVVYDYHAVCPECEARQIMKFENFTWPCKGQMPEGEEAKKKLANEIERDELAEYACNSCGVLWDEYMRIKALRPGEWLPRHPVYKRPISIGAVFPSWNSTFKKMSSIVARWIRAQGDPGKLRGWYNNEAAEPFVDVQIDRKEETILILKDERPRGLVPKGISCLTAAVDTQQRGFYYEVRAWGYGTELESYQVREGFVETFDGLHRILFGDEYKDSDGNKKIIELALIDSGGGATDYGSSRTAEVYDFCRRFPGVYPIKGMQRMNQPYRVSQIDNYPGTNKPIPCGLKLFILNTTYFKDFLARKLEINPADPGAWHLHSEATEEYARQMCAEYKNEKGLWQCPKNKPNHFWDIGVYSLAAVEILGVKFWETPAAKSSKSVPQTKIKKQKIKNRRW